MTIVDKEENIEFNWGKKKGVGGRNRDVKFYESFTYDGVKYNLFDSVYLYKEGEEEPYIGKLIKIWENADKTKKVKILWFFRPYEILNFLSTNETRDNELFLASGEGVGLANVNPLEALVGKCNVICISKDSRNPQPVDEEVQKAEYVFYRVFDVGHRKISDKLDDQIAGTDVKNLLNKLGSQKPVGLMELGLDRKEVSGKDMEKNEVVMPPSQNNGQSVAKEENGKFVETLVTENADCKSSMGKIPTSNVGVVEASMSNGGFSSASNDKSMPMVEAKGNEDCNASLVKQKSSNENPFASGEGLERQQLTKGYVRSKTISSEKIASTSKIGEGGGKSVAVGGSNRQDVEGDGKSTCDSNGLVEDKHATKTKRGDSRINVDEKRGDSVQRTRLIHDDDDDNTKILAPSVPSLKDKHKLQREKDSSDVEGESSKRLKLDNKPTKLTHDKLHKQSSTKSPNGEQKLNSCTWEVTRRPDADKSRWFKGFPWEERMNSAHEQGRLVLLQNLDPSLTSQEVEDVVWHAFKESCTAKMIQATAFSSPHSGQAFVIFKRREAAEAAVQKLKQSCLLMSNGRPLVGSIGNPCFPEIKPKFYGHIVIDQLRMQIQREMRDAVSTSHCSQANNVEYDLAMDWWLLQERTDCAWKRLFQRQGDELRKVKAKLTAK